jgi:hypothetical protein
MDRLEIIDGTNWEEFTSSPLAVLVLAKSGCAACQAWSEDLHSFLSRDQQWSSVRFGKMLLDKPGLTSFKRQSPWLAEVDVLPFNVIYVHGERKKSFPGSGLDRLLTRLEGLKNS